MYSTCIFCYAPLGRNEVIEAFPVGRRLAFDAARGRLWVICQRCGRWNLSPLEARWEALEICERAFQHTRTRVSTEHVGLARLSEGLELVRVGRPARGEFAAWRYEATLLRRARSYSLQVVGATGVGLGFLTAMNLGLVSTGLVPVIAFGPVGIQYALRERKIVARVTTGGERVIVRGRNARSARLLTSGGESSWALRVRSRTQSIDVEGENATFVLGRVLAHLNMGGSSRAGVQRAVKEIERAGDATSLIAEAAGASYKSVTRIPGEQLTALEMASHEEIERQVATGELKSLEQAWREAEEVAAIADSLVLPTGIHERLRSLRERGK